MGGWKREGVYELRAYGGYDLDKARIIRNVVKLHKIKAILSSLDEKLCHIKKIE